MERDEAIQQCQPCWEPTALGGRKKHMGRMLCYLGLHHTQRMLRKMGRRGLKLPDTSPVLSQAGWGQGDGPLAESKLPLDTQGLPESPCPHPSLSSGQPGGSAGVAQTNPGLGRERVQGRSCGCLIAPYEHLQGPGGWGDACSAGAPSAGHGRVGNRRNTTEKEFRLPGAAVQAPPGCFPPQQEVARSASSRRRPHSAFAGPVGTQGLPVATLSPERVPTARPDLAEKPSALFRSDLHPGDAAALGGAGAD